MVAYGDMTYHFPSCLGTRCPSRSNLKYWNEIFRSESTAWRIFCTVYRSCEFGVLMASDTRMFGCSWLRWDGPAMAASFAISCRLRVFDMNWADATASIRIWSSGSSIVRSM